MTGVIADEAEFFDDPQSGQRVPIDPAQDLRAGSITQLDASMEELATLGGLFTPDVLAVLGPGEAEALAIAWNRRSEEFTFVTGDGLAIQCFVMLGLRDRLASLEAVLRQIGFTRPLPHFQREDFLRKHCEIGSLRRIQGDGLRFDPFG